MEKVGRKYEDIPESVDKRAYLGAKMNHSRVIFHSDLNNFFASVECALNPALRGHPVAVCGSVEDRHGIVLAKNNLAKSYEVKTGDAIWQAKNKCPGIIFVQANYENYVKYSQEARKIYSEYTDKVEPFGADEAWLDLSGHKRAKNFDEARLLADEIRNEIFSRIGLTVSIGVSYNKVFAKLASDYKKPDATTVFSPLEYSDIISKLPVEDMIYIGKSTRATLSRYGITTIGELAGTSEAFIKTVFGKNGIEMRKRARGEDVSPVIPEQESGVIKSIGNSSTPPRDLADNEDIRAMCYILSEKVGARLRAHGLKCACVQLSIRESDLTVHEHQVSLELPTNSTVKIADTAFKLFCSVYDWHIPVRSIGVRTTKLVSENTPFQLSLFDGEIRERERNSVIDRTVDRVRERFGDEAVLRGVVMRDMGKLRGGSQDETRLKCAFRQH